MSSTTRDADQRLSHDSDAARTRWPQDDVEADAVPGSKTRVGGIHLIVLVHGLFGSQANLQSAKEEIVKAAEEQEQREMTTRRDDGRSSKSGGDKEEGTRVIGGNGLVQDESSDGNRGATNTLGNGKPLSAGSSSTSTTTTTDTEPTQAADANTQPAPASSSLSSPLLTTRVLVPTSFPGSMTYDGLEVLAGRVAGEVSLSAKQREGQMWARGRGVGLEAKKKKVERIGSCRGSVRGRRAGQSLTGKTFAGETVVGGRPTRWQYQELERERERESEGDDDRRPDRGRHCCADSRPAPRLG